MKQTCLLEPLGLIDLSKLRRHTARAMIGSKQLKVGMAIIFKGEVYRVMEVSHVQPGKGGAFIQAKLRNVITGLQTEHKYRSGEPVEKAIIDTREIEYLYEDGDLYHFMDSETYDQFHITHETLGDAVQYLTPNLKLLVEKHEDRFIGIELPKMVRLTVMETEPYIKTATATNAYKGAKVETGATFQVPGFINEGERIEIDTTTGKYLGRAKED